MILEINLARCVQIRKSKLSGTQRHLLKNVCFFREFFLGMDIDILKSQAHTLQKEIFCVFYLNTFQFSSVAQSCPTLCDPMNCSTPGLPVHHQLPESTQTHVHRVGDAIQPSHPLSSPSPPALNLPQHQDLFK